MKRSNLRNQNLHFRTPLIVLSIAAAFFLCVTVACNFYKFFLHPGNAPIGWSVVFSIFGFIGSIFLLLYTILHQKPKASILILLSFALIGLMFLKEFLYCLFGYIKICNELNGYLLSLPRFFRLFRYTSIGQLALYTSFAVFLLLSACFAYKGASNKVFCILSIAFDGIALMFSVIPALKTLPYCFKGIIVHFSRNRPFIYFLDLFYYKQPFSQIASLLICAALLLLALNFLLKHAATPAAAPTPALDPEQALIQLNERRSREEISDEEYQAQRAEIIRNL